MRFICIPTQRGGQFSCFESNKYNSQHASQRKHTIACGELNSRQSPHTLGWPASLTLHAGGRRLMLSPPLHTIDPPRIDWRKIGTTSTRTKGPTLRKRQTRGDRRTTCSATTILPVGGKPSSFSRPMAPSSSTTLSPTLPPPDLTMSRRRLWKATAVWTTLS